ncbi:MAG TPA: peptide chain release factor N(5)-glutamine methyltransferase [Solirubrobacteraceae bacterium]|jgi:release factor glutamine methyltransferase|nr:peptide chain release factor N(5)-glutamine methyltransferase [Solirubrobacteraceae bacterium]
MPPRSSVGSIARGTPARDALDGAVTAIAAAGCETPRLDAELLLADALGISRERLFVACMAAPAAQGVSSGVSPAPGNSRRDKDELVVAGAAVRRFQDFVRRRSVLREPVAYILGRRHFRRLELTSDPRALIPRPETELLVEVALSLPEDWRVLDVGTGSGAVALALKDERPDLGVTGSDLSTDALALARANGERLGLDVHWLTADLLEDVPDEFEAILSNPPYVPEGDRAMLEPEIVRHEPSRALFAGEDGLDAIRPLIGQAAARPSVRLLALEVGAGQAAAVGELMRAAGFQSVRAERDLARIERVVVGERA